MSQFYPDDVYFIRHSQQQPPSSAKLAETMMMAISSSSSSALIHHGTAELSGRPLVILAGWLGCQPKSLRRYQALYERLGIQSTIVIAPPRLVVRATSRPATLQPPPPPPRWPNNNNNNDDDTATTPIQTVNDLAWSVLQHVHHSQTPYFFFHSFSNGGCFVWEEIRNILNSTITPSSKLVNVNNNNNNDNDNTMQPGDDDNADITSKITDHSSTNHVIRSLREKLVGVVFDSSPAALGDGRDAWGPLHRALSYCSWTERWPLLLEVYTKTWLQPHFAEQSRQRAQAFYAGMRDDPWIIPQLYLYSQDDALTQFAPLDDLVHHRQRVLGPNVISYRTWESSPHCCHLLQHPQDYQQAVEEFVRKCLQQQQQQQQQETPILSSRL